MSISSTNDCWPTHDYITHSPHRKVKVKQGHSCDSCSWHLMVMQAPSLWLALLSIHEMGVVWRLCLLILPVQEHTGLCLCSTGAQGNRTWYVLLMHQRPEPCTFTLKPWLCLNWASWCVCLCMCAPPPPPFPCLCVADRHPLFYHDQSKLRKADVKHFLEITQSTQKTSSCWLNMYEWTLI